MHPCLGDVLASLLHVMFIVLSGAPEKKKPKKTNTTKFTRIILWKTKLFDIYKYTEGIPKNKSHVLHASARQLLGELCHELPWVFFAAILHSNWTHLGSALITGEFLRKSWYPLVKSPQQWPPGISSFWDSGSKYPIGTPGSQNSLKIENNLTH